MWFSISLEILQNCGDFKTFQIVKILILRIILTKLQNSKKNSYKTTKMTFYKNFTKFYNKILRIRMLVNTAPDIEHKNSKTVHYSYLCRE